MSDVLVDTPTRAQRQDAAARWFRQLRDDICTSFEAIVSAQGKPPSMGVGETWAETDITFNV